MDTVSQVFDPGASSTIGLDIRNASNVAVDSLTIQEPKNAPADAATLHASNPFTITDFAGFDDVSLPAGCEDVQVDAYVFADSKWSWVSGTPAPHRRGSELPAGVSNGEVGGIRITCTGDMAPGQTISVDLDLEQRATHRNDSSDLSTAVHRVDNVTTGEAAAEGQDPATDDGAAS
ncbi:hypothetical protein [Aeromicrobium sp. UC242_57]|uniref:hypothetical protein n=1 Tax=Aeromicrobium sp. UC242_57 TaxID=3374624 RepID=UPI0037B9A91C